MNELYLTDSYLKEFDATVKSIKDGKFVVLDQTAFYPSSGGQAHDTGVITTEDGNQVNVIFVGKFSGQISHQVEPENVLKEGDIVHCTINWNHRYKLMRMHTAAHLLSAIMHKEAGALITGNQLEEDRSRIDFSMENFDKEKIQEYLAKANEYIQQDKPVTISFMPREEALKIPGMVKLAGALPPDIKELRIVEIQDIDKQADGGTHVKSLKEIGEIIFLKAENKGKSNRRVYYTVS